MRIQKADISIFKRMYINRFVSKTGLFLPIENDNRYRYLSSVKRVLAKIDSFSRKKRCHRIQEQKE